MTYPDPTDDVAAGSDGSGESGSATVTLRRDEIRSMERDAKQARQAMEQVTALQRELAFAKSGHEFSDKQQKALLSVVDGDLTPEAIRAAAAELGFAAPAGGSWDSADDDMAALDRVTAASAGSSVPPPKTPDFNAQLRAAAGR